MVNNAAIGPPEDVFGRHKGPIPEDLIDETFEINYRSLVTLNALFTQAFYEDSKIINIGSRAGVLKRMNFHLGNKIMAYMHLLDPSIEYHEQMMQEFKTAALKGKHLDVGYNNSVYSMAKCLVLRYTQDILPELLTPNQ